MKFSKKLSTLFATFVLLAALLIGSAITASAATSIPSKIRIFPGNVDNYAVNFDLPAVGDKIKNLKSSNKNLYVKQTGKNDHKDSWDSSNDGSSVILGLYAKKSGTYKVTFDIYSSKNKKKSSKSITVYAKSDSPIKKFTYNGKAYNYNVNDAASGKIKVTMNSGYKLKKIEVGKYQVKNTTSGKESAIKYTTVKNGSKITLSKVPYTYEFKYGSLSGDSYSYNFSKRMSAETIVLITYIDKYTKQTATMSYTLHRFVG